MRYNNFQWSGYDAANPSHQVLRDFLILDIQENQTLAGDLLQHIQQLQKGEEEKAGELTFGGNLFLCTLHQAYATIDLLQDSEDFGEPKRYPLVELNIAVSAWLRYLQGAG
ncbi:hypothetical protein TDB9533_03818 [Thalassocella blandensis]|nr:hypothetical protein TDB9533_03818 [Thalassocella blandensis]